MCLKNEQECTIIIVFIHTISLVIHKLTDEVDICGKISPCW